MKVRFIRDSDVPALSDLITSMVASGYDYRRDDDSGLWEFSRSDLCHYLCIM